MEVCPLAWAQYWGDWASGERMEPGSTYILVLCAWEHGVRKLHSNEGLRIILPSLIFSDMQGWKNRENNMERQNRVREGRPK